MTPQEIRAAKEYAYEEILNAEKRLKVIRDICPHENITKGLWQSRVGHIEETLICKDCGANIKDLET